MDLLFLYNTRFSLTPTIERPGRNSRSARCKTLLAQIQNERDNIVGSRFKDEYFYRT